jgi:glycosyltransferase involved in cell wall biosynthesis
MNRALVKSNRRRVDVGQALQPDIPRPAHDAGQAFQPDILRQAEECQAGKPDLQPETAQTRTDSWLASRSRGRAPRGSVLFHAPSHALQAPGGGEIQLIQTGRYLDALGIRIRLFSAWTDQVAQARLVHLFGMSREGLELARVARGRGVPVVLSPICWYEIRAMLALEPNRPRKLRSLAAWSLRLAMPRLPSWRRELLELAAAVLPNSPSEADQLARLFGVDRGKLRVVPNGVRPELGSVGPEPFRRQFGNQPFVLSVSRIEPRKNTLGLIRAVRSLGLPLVVVGQAPPSCEDYARECRRAGAGNVFWLGQLDHHDPLLASVYAAARVFALPSWFETPGLAALEAALAGCPVVITPYGSTRDYFGELAEYARPHRVDEIAQAIRTCWKGDPDPRLARLIAMRYVWPKVAQKTAEVYDQVAP